MEPCRHSDGRVSIKTKSDNWKWTKWLFVRRFWMAEHRYLHLLNKGLPFCMHLVCLLFFFLPLFSICIEFVNRHIIYKYINSTIYRKTFKHFLWVNRGQQTHAHHQLPNHQWITRIQMIYLFWRVLSLTWCSDEFHIYVEKNRT